MPGSLARALGGAPASLLRAPLAARRRRPPQRARRRAAVVAPSASSKNDDADAADESSSPELDMGSLSRRVAEIKALEDANQANLRVLVLDATLPGQRLSLRFDAKDTRRRLGLGTELGVGAAVGDTYAMLGQAPASGQVLPLGTEVKLTRVDPLPDGSGDVEVEMVGVRRLRIEGQPFDENGVAMAKVTYMRFAPEETPPLPRDNESVAPTSPRPIEGGGAPGSGSYDESDDPEKAELETTRMSDELESLVDEARPVSHWSPCDPVHVWTVLVRTGGRERVPGQLELIASHLGPMPARASKARRAAWVAALINPIPALGVAYEIRPALLMARDTRGMLKVATDGIKTSIERLRKDALEDQLEGSK